MADIMLAQLPTRRPGHEQLQQPQYGNIILPYHSVPGSKLPEITNAGLVQCSLPVHIIGTWDGTRIAIGASIVLSPYALSQLPSRFGGNGGSETESDEASDDAQPSSDSDDANAPGGGQTNGHRAPPSLACAGSRLARLASRASIAPPPLLASA